MLTGPYHSQSNAHPKWPLFWASWAALAIYLEVKSLQQWVLQPRIPRHHSWPNSPLRPPLWSWQITLMILLDATSIQNLVPKLWIIERLQHHSQLTFLLWDFTPNCSHLPVSLSCRSPLPTSLPGKTTAQINITQQCSPGESHASLTTLTVSASPNLSPTMQLAPSQSVTEALALPADKCCSGCLLVPSKHLEAMHEIVPKGLPLWIAPWERELQLTSTSRIDKAHQRALSHPRSWFWVAGMHKLWVWNHDRNKRCVKAILFSITAPITVYRMPYPLLTFAQKSGTNKSWNGWWKYEAVPTISDSADFGIALMKWWHGMQPDFCKSEHNMPLSTYMALTLIMWDPLRKAGPNGIVSVLTMVVWWGQSLAAHTQWQDDSNGEWKAFIIDIQRTLLEIAKTTIEQKKCGAPGGIQKKSKHMKV